MVVYERHDLACFMEHVIIPESRTSPLASCISGTSGLVSGHCRRADATRVVGRIRRSRSPLCQGGRGGGAGAGSRYAARRLWALVNVCYGCTRCCTKCLLWRGFRGLTGSDTCILHSRQSEQAFGCSSTAAAFFIRVSSFVARISFVS